MWGKTKCTILSNWTAADLIRRVERSGLETPADLAKLERLEKTLAELKTQQDGLTRQLDELEMAEDAKWRNRLDQIRKQYGLSGPIEPLPAWPLDRAKVGVDARVEALVDALVLPASDVKQPDHQEHKPEKKAFGDILREMMLLHPSDREAPTPAEPSAPEPSAPERRGLEPPDLWRHMLLLEPTVRADP
jgi:hypothetical protein